MTLDHNASWASYRYITLKLNSNTYITDLTIYHGLIGLISHYRIYNLFASNSYCKFYVAKTNMAMLIFHALKSKYELLDACGICLYIYTVGYLLIIQPVFTCTSNVERYFVAELLFSLQTNPSVQVLVNCHRVS